MNDKENAKMERDQIACVAALMWERCRQEDRNRGLPLVSWTRLPARMKVYIRAAAEWAITHGAQP